MNNYCYILKNDENNKTYNGYTNNLNRRIRQHNGEIKGGAKSTQCEKTWKFYAVIAGFETRKEALSCEWKIKHPTNEKRRPPIYCGPVGRIKSLNIVLALDNWTSKSTGLSNQNEYTLYIHEEYKNIIDKNIIKQNVKILNINDIIY